MKIKRKARKVTIITITVIAIALVIAMPIMYAFTEAKTIYEVLWLLGFAWCVCFNNSNGKRCKDVY